MSRRGVEVIEFTRGQGEVYKETEKIGLVRCNLRVEQVYLVGPYGSKESGVIKTSGDIVAIGRDVAQVLESAFRIREELELRLQDERKFRFQIEEPGEGTFEISGGGRPGN